MGMGWESNERLGRSLRNAACEVSNDEGGRKGQKAGAGRRARNEAG